MWDFFCGTMCHMLIMALVIYTLSGDLSDILGLVRKCLLGLVHFILVNVKTECCLTRQDLIKFTVDDILEFCWRKIHIKSHAFYNLKITKISSAAVLTDFVKLHILPGITCGTITFLLASRY